MLDSFDGTICIGTSFWISKKSIAYLEFYTSSFLLQYLYIIIFPFEESLKEFANWTVLSKILIKLISLVEKIAILIKNFRVGYRGGVDISICHFIDNNWKSENIDKIISEQTFFKIWILSLFIDIFIDISIFQWYFLYILLNHLIILYITKYQINND